MGAITYKCPNCGGELVFEPKTQNYVCSYCRSEFTQDELDQLDPDAGAESTSDEETHASEDEAASYSSDGEQAVSYSCPSCGAEIMTSETTAATYCYYCHNPVVLNGRVSGEWQPDAVIPFRIDKKTAQEKLRDFIGKKRFVPKHFYDDSQIEKLTGVYYPYWVYDADVDGVLQAKTTKVHVMRHGDEEITETEVFEVRRGGTLRFEDITRNALTSEHRELVENVQPFTLSELKDFKMSYLSGFQAERRNLEKEGFNAEVKKEAEGYAEKALKESISGYTTVKVQGTNLKTVDQRWRYCLFPVWVMTYRSLSGRVYYYALNGQTGEAAGKLPVDKKKLALTSLFTGALAGAAVFAAMFFLM